MNRRRHQAPSTVPKASSPAPASGGCPYGRTSLSGCRSPGASRRGADSRAGGLEVIGAGETLTASSWTPLPQELPVGVIAEEGEAAILLIDRSPSVTFVPTYQSLTGGK